jgi:hypothetical protein
VAAFCWRPGESDCRLDADVYEGSPPGPDTIQEYVGTRPVLTGWEHPPDYPTELQCRWLSGGESVYYRGRAQDPASAPKWKNYPNPQFRK